jgi:AraC-like DNA-binding protein
MGERLYLRLDEDGTHGPESDTPAGTLRMLAVPPGLRGTVANILVHHERLADGDEVVERVLPDGAVRLVFNFARAPSAGDREAPAAGVIGASAAPALVRLRGTMHGLTVTLRPGAATALGLPAGEISGTIAPLETYWGGAAAELHERLQTATDDAQRVASLEAGLRPRQRSADATAPAAVASALRQIGATGGRRSVPEIAAALGIGERRLQQLFHTHVGLTPRATSRLARLHALLRTLRAQPAPAWAELAIDAGYCDQPHLANEFRALCGLTPREFLGRAASGSSKTAH